MSRKLIWILSALTITSIVTLFASESPGDVHVSPYVWANACRECHPEIYRAWAKTKHKSALLRLVEREREGRCVTCHTTGTQGVVSNGVETLNAGVQCEACHGPALAHASAATDTFPLTEGLTRPDEKVCVKCHCEGGPHYQWFDFEMMSEFVHPVVEP